MGIGPPQGFWTQPSTSQASTAALGPFGLPINVVRDYNASGSAESYVGTMQQGSTEITGLGANDFQSGNGIAVSGAGRLANPSSGLTLAQAAGSSSFSDDATVYVTYAFRDNSGNSTLAAQQADIEIAASGNVVTTSIDLPNNAGAAALYVGTSSGPNLLGTIDGSGDIVYSGGLGAGLAVVVGGADGRTLSVTISAPANDSGSAQPDSNATAVPLITTVSSGAGGSTMTLADSAANAVSGATVTHDDTAACLSAISKANAAGLTLEFPEGTYYLSQTLGIGQWVVGRGANGQCVLKAVAGINVASLVRPASITGSQEYFYFQGFYIDGNESNGALFSGAVVELQGVFNNSFVDQLVVAAYSALAGIRVGPGTGTAPDGGGAGAIRFGNVWINPGTDSAGVVLTSVYGDVETYVEGIRFDHCQIENTGTAPGLHCATASVGKLRGCSFPDLWFNGGTGYDILIEGLANSRFGLVKLGTTDGATGIYISSATGQTSAGLTFDDVYSTSSTIGDYLNDAGTGAVFAGPFARYSQLAAAFGGQQPAGHIGVPVLIQAVQGQHVTTTGSSNILSFTAPATGTYEFSGYLYLNNGTSGNDITFSVGFSDGSIDVGGAVYFLATGQGSNVILLAGGTSVANGQWSCPAMPLYVRAGTTVTVAFNDPTNTPSDYVTVMVKRVA